MTFDEALDLDDRTPIRLADSTLGLVIRRAAIDETIGVQVPGEEEIRWIAVARVTDHGNGALTEDAAGVG